MLMWIVLDGDRKSLWGWDEMKLCGHDWDKLNPWEGVRTGKLMEWVGMGTIYLTVSFSSVRLRTHCSSTRRNNFKNAVMRGRTREQTLSVSESIPEHCRPRVHCVINATVVCEFL